MKNYDSAKESYLKLLKYIKNNIGKTDPHSGLTFGSQNEGFIYYTYRTLANIEMAQKNYNQAIHYLNETQNQHYRQSCGNAIMSEIIGTASLYSDCYSNLKDDEKVSDILIPVINILRNSTELTRLYETLLKKYKKEELKKLFERSFKNLYSKEGIINEYQNTIYYVKFLDRDIILYDLGFKNLSKNETQKRLNKTLKESLFYALLSK